LIEDYDIGYVATGRDLLRPGGGTASPPLLVGAPDFGEQQPAAVKSTKDAKPETELRLTSRAGISDLRSFATLSFPPLPGTLDEVQMLAGLLKQRNENPTLLTGAQATEEAVKSAKHPRILHLATHGFFLPDSGLEEAMAGDNQRGMGVRPTGETDPGAGVKLWQQLKLKNPMHRSGIALAGANDTILGRREPGGNDGILTAEEVAGMDLWGTQLVVISACESGLGEARGGEGVFGLRRAFTMAGAQSLIMSLWSVNDVATCRLMQRMHACMAGERTPQRALLRAQRDAITDMRKAGLNPHPFYWSAFVASGIGLGLEKN